MKKKTKKTAKEIPAWVSKAREHVKGDLNEDQAAIVYFHDHAKKKTAISSNIRAEDLALFLHEALAGVEEREDRLIMFTSIFAAITFLIKGGKITVHDLNRQLDHVSDALPGVR